MLIKSFPFEAKVDLDKNEFEGYASTFGNRDLVGDIVERGAFAKTIQERFPKGMVKVLWQHYDPMGMPKHMEEDSKGLYVVAKVSKTRENQDRLQLMKDGVVDRLSIGYDVVKREVDDSAKDRTVRLKELKLYEFSPVTFPANEEAVITGVKGRELEELLKRIPQLEQYLKAGRVLSAANRQKVEAAIKALQALLVTFKEPEKSTPKGQEPPMLDGIDPDEFQSVLSELRNYRKLTFGG